jgi:DNA-binding transcriptional ArsR family regulator
MLTTNHPPKDQIRIEEVLSALGHPLRITVLKVLSDGQEHNCGSILKGQSKSTMTHHWRVLRDAGVIWRRPDGRENLLSLRKDDLDDRFPGFLDSIIKSVKEDRLTVETVLLNQQQAA